MTLETIFIFFMSIVLLWIKPGPGQALRIATTLNDSFKAGMAISFGVVISCNIFLLVAILGSSLLANFLHDAGLYLKIFGGLYLIYLGYKGLRTQETKTRQPLQKRDVLKYITLGFFVSLSNPIDIFFFAGILPAIMDITALSPQDIIIAMLVLSFTALSIDALILVLVSQSKTALIDTPVSKFINKTACIGFILIGLYFLYSAFINTNYSFELF